MIRAPEKIEETLYDKWHVRLHKHVRHHIHKMRKRPDHHKDIISFTVAFIVTAIVFTGWYFISLPKTLALYELNKKENNALNKGNPLQEIRSRTYDGLSGATEANVEVE